MPRPGGFGPRRSTAVARTIRSARLSGSIAAAVLIAGCAPAGDADPAASEPPATEAAAGPSASPIESSSIAARIAELETWYDARVGVSVIEPRSGREFEYRADERFGYASSIKALAAGILLRTTTPEDLVAPVRWTQADVDRAGYSPVTSARIDEGLTLGELGEAAVRRSDNAATNLVLQAIGGPSELRRELRGLGDAMTEPINDEPALNRIEPGSTADTTSPAAFTAALSELLAGDALTDADRATLVAWMSGNATGDALIRAGVPVGWTVADKSGGAGAIRNDVAMVTPPDGPPLYVSIFTTRVDPTAEYEDALVAEVAEVVFAEF